MREHNIQYIAHLSYYTNANGLLLVFYSKLGSAKFSLAEEEGQAERAVGAVGLEDAEGAEVDELGGEQRVN